MKMQIETITPERAAQYMELNESNRPLLSQWVRLLAASIRRGEWKENGESIKFSKGKKLLDGQAAKKHSRIFNNRASHDQR